MTNLAAITTNASMPVGPAAVVAAGIAGSDDPGALNQGSQQLLERPGARLRFLGDIVPLPLLRQPG